MASRKILKIRGDVTVASLRVLLLLPWGGGSHLSWAEGYQRHSGHKISVLGLADDRWRWRMHGGAVALSEQIQRWVAANGRPDVVMLTSPIDGARLLGLCRHELVGVPVVMYQHESQILYPDPRVRPGASISEIGYGDFLPDWYTWLACDAVWFNTEWHRQSVIEELPELLKAFPDRDHDRRLASVIARFETVPLGLDLSWAVPEGRRNDVPVIIWPHRWSPDKAPEEFAGGLEHLRARGIAFRLVLAGEAVIAGVDRRDQLAARFADELLAAGPFTAEEYRYWVTRSDVVVSCARHEFFGIGVAEAVAAGAVPVVPHALAYPEVLGPSARRFLYDAGGFADHLATVVAGIGADRSAWHHRWANVAAHVRGYDWLTMAVRYDEKLARIVADRR